MKKSIAAFAALTVVVAAVAGIATASSAKQAGMSDKNIVQTATLSIRVAGGRVFVGGAQVITPDVMASNGVIHVIDKALIPR